MDEKDKKIAELMEQLAASKLKADEERQAKEEAQRQFEEEKKIADEERKAKEEAQRQFEEEKKKADEERKAKEEAERKAEEERRAKEEAERKTQEAERIAEEERKKAKEAEEGTDLYALTLPEGKRIFGNSSSAVQDKEHEDATLEVKELAILEPENKTPKHQPLLKGSIRADGYVHYSNEADVTYLVRQYLEALINAGGLGPKIELAAELYISKFRPDVVIVYNRLRIPCGVVEVKLPGPPERQSNDTSVSDSGSSDRKLRSSASAPVQQQPEENGTLDSKRFQGQIFNYLHFLRTFYDVEHPFGIMTTYEEWRVCWLKKDSVTTRGFEGTEIMRYDHAGIHRMIMTALVHMSKPPNTQAKSLHEKVGTYFPFIDKDGITWRPLAKQPSDDEFPPKHSTGFMLLEPAGSGTEGKAWIACNSGWKLCVIKTFTVKPKRQDISQVQITVNREVEIWEKGFGVKIFSVMLSGAPSVVMPRLRLAQEHGANALSLQDGDMEAVREAVRKYAQYGKVAEDLKWSHVGFLEKNPKDGKPLKKKVAILFDSRPKDHENKKEAEQIMLKKLGL